MEAIYCCTSYIEPSTETLRSLTRVQHDGSLSICEWPVSMKICLVWFKILHPKWSEQNSSKSNGGRFWWDPTIDRVIKVSRQTLNNTQIWNNDIHSIHYTISVCKVHSIHDRNGRIIKLRVFLCRKGQG